MSIIGIILRIVVTLLLACVIFVVESSIVLWLFGSIPQPKEKQKAEDLKQKAAENAKK